VLLLVVVTVLVLVDVLLSCIAVEPSFATGPLLPDCVEVAVAVCVIVPSDPLVVVVGLAQAVLAPPNARAMAPASTVLRMSNS
jgi:hypothetical protein